MNTSKANSVLPISLLQKFMNKFKSAKLKILKKDSYCLILSTKVINKKTN